VIVAELVGEYLQITADEDGILELCRALRSSSENTTIQLSPKETRICSENELGAIKITRSSGPLHIGMVDNSIAVSGSSDFLKLMAQNIQCILDPCVTRVSGGINPHTHIEYYDGHFFLDSKSSPLIVELKV
jgi:hypothetical protein